MFVDRSNVNGADDYRVAGVHHLYLKATEGTTFIDASNANRHAQAAAEGVAVTGDYHFADLDDPAAECAFFLSHARVHTPGQFRGCLDLERGTVITDVAWAESWVAAYREHVGHLPVVYGSTSLIAPLRAASKLIRACPWWRAEYGPNDGADHPLEGGALGAAAHQYTSVAHVTGLAGDVDRSVFVSPSGARSMLIPNPPRLVPIPPEAWLWAEWKIGVARFKGHAGDAAYRPATLPARIPARLWPACARAAWWYYSHGVVS